MMKMISMDIRKIIVADRKDGIEIKAISKAVHVSESAIYRLLQKKRKAGTIEPSYQSSGRQSKVTTQKLAKMEALVTEDPDITLAEIKKVMHPSILKSEINNILHNKLGLQYKKMAHASERDRANVKIRRTIWNKMQSSMDAASLVFLDERRHQYEFNSPVWPSQRKRTREGQRATEYAKSYNDFVFRAG